jgi:hypothetical protein
MMVAVAAVSAAAVVGGSVAAFATGPDGEHGHGFNCTPGNPHNAEFQHESRGIDDHGNGDDCLEAATVPTTTTVQPAAPVTPATPAVAPAAAAAPSAAVAVQPRTTG